MQDAILSAFVAEGGLRTLEEWLVAASEHGKLLLLLLLLDVLEACAHLVFFKRPRPRLGQSFRWLSPLPRPFVRDAEAANHSRRASHLRPGQDGVQAEEADESA